MLFRSVIINKGVAEGDVLLLSEPEKPEDLEITGWEIYQEQQAKQKEQKIKNASADKADSVKAGLKSPKQQ